MIAKTQQAIDAEADAYLRIGLKIAREIFAQRGNHSEAHLSEGELAGICAAAAQIAAEAHRADS